MVHTTIYAVNKRFATQTIDGHLCDDVYNQKTRCMEAGTVVDTATGHHVCSGCSRITRSSGLRECDICYKEYIDKNSYQNPEFETVDPRCKELYDV